MASHVVAQRAAQSDAAHSRYAREVGFEKSVRCLLFMILAPSFERQKAACAPADLASTVQLSSVADYASPLPGDAGHLTAVSRNSFKQILVIEHSDMRARSTHFPVQRSHALLYVMPHVTSSVLSCRFTEPRATYSCGNRSSKSQSCDKRFM